MEGKGKLERMQEERSLYEKSFEPIGSKIVKHERNEKNERNKKIVEKESETILKKIVNPMKKKEKDVVKDVVSEEIFSSMVLFIVEQNKASISMLQKRFQIGYNKAKSVICNMEQMGIISEADGKKPRAVLMTFEEWQEKKS